MPHALPLAALLRLQHAADSRASRRAASALAVHSRAIGRHHLILQPRLDSVDREDAARANHACVRVQARLLRRAAAADNGAQQPHDYTMFPSQRACRMRFSLDARPD